MTELSLRRKIFPSNNVAGNTIYSQLDVFEQSIGTLHYGLRGADLCLS